MCLILSPLVDVWHVPSLGLLKLLSTFLYKSVCERALTFLLGKCLWWQLLEQRQRH